MKFYKSLAPLLILFMFLTVITPVNSFGGTSTVLRMSDRQDDFDKKFREGRDLIDQEDWAKAAAKFAEIIDKYPQNKSADAALYWLAYCYKKQKKYKEVEAVINRLFADFPNSGWVNDAKVMKLEISPASGLSTTTAIINPSAKSPVSAQTFEIYGAMEGFENNNSNAPLDREDEIKIAAFQSLLSADAKRAIEAMRGILKSDSKSSEGLKIEVLRAIRRSPLGNNYASQALTTTAATVISVNKELTPLLRETLIQSLQNETGVKIRKEMIYTLANLKDEASVEYLARLYVAEKDREVKKAIINGFGSNWGITGLTVARSSTNSSSQNPNVIVTGSTQTRNVVSTKLLEIVKTEKDSELKSLALSNLQRFGNWETDAPIMETLSRIYDSETNEDFKKIVIQSLGKTKQAQASQKLFEIARNDKSDKLRLEAIYALRNMGTPDALKFLEELLK